MVETIAASVEFDPPLDAGIERTVLTLKEAGFETFESCEGGPGHTYPEPTVRFYGDRAEGFRAYAAVVHAGLPVAELRTRERMGWQGEPISQSGVEAGRDRLQGIG